MSDEVTGFMNKKSIKLCCALLCCFIVAMSVAPMSRAAVTYPDGVTKQTAESTISKTDNVIYSLLMNTQNKTLKDIVSPEIYCSKTLSSLTVGIYQMLLEYETSFSSMGVDISTSAVAKALSNYSDVSSKLSQYSSWSDVNLDTADWGVSDKRGFVIAAGNIFAPFNELLYTVLCSGTMSIGPLLSIKGSNGYETAIIPTLKALGCEAITDSSVFYSDAESIKNTMIEHIVDDVLTFLEGVLDAPCEKLSSVLPSIAYYFTNGGFDSAVATLTEPLRIQIFNISTLMTAGTLLSFISDSESYTQSFTLNFNDTISSMGYNVAEIDLQQVASMGTVEGDTVVADRADVFMWLLSWLVDTAKLNKSTLSSMITGEQGEIDLNEVLTKLLDKPTDELIKTFFEILNSTSGVRNDHLWTFSVITPAEVQYTANLAEEKYQRVVDGIDDLLNEVIAEGAEYKTVREAFQGEIYSNAVVSELVVGLYSAFENEDIKELLPLIGIDVSPSAVASLLNESKYSIAKNILSKSSSFSNIDKESLSWGFENGSKDGFIDALCAALRPLEGVLNMLLAEDKITLLGSIDFYGSDGYNTAVIPVLEAIGCSTNSIKTYNEYKQSVQKGEGTKVILEAVCSLVERVLDRPVYTILEILPNLMYFIGDGGVSICINNLIYPVTEMISRLDMNDVIDMSQLQNINIQEIANELIASADLGINIPTIDLMQFSNMGELVTVNSKRTYKGSDTAISYVQANKPAVMVTLMRILVEIVKAPGNEDMLTSLMGEMTQNVEGGAMLSNLSGSLSADIAAMSVDETVEWLYKLFFRERVVKEEKIEEEYLPTIIFKPKATASNYIVWLTPFVLLAFAEVIYIKKKDKIKAFLEKRKEMKMNETQTISQEV